MKVKEKVKSLERLEKMRALYIDFLEKCEPTLSDNDQLKLNAEIHRLNFQINSLKGLIDKLNSMSDIERRIYKIQMGSNAIKEQKSRWYFKNKQLNKSA